MGWFYTDRKPGESIAAFIQREYPNLEFLDSAVVKLRTFYAAARNPHSSTPDTVFALIFQLDPHGDGTYNFGYRDQDESQGPCECECPERILNLLSDPPCNEYAARWRATCRENIAARKAHTAARRALPKLAVGMLVCSEKPLAVDGNLIHHMRINQVSRTYIRATAYFKPDAPYGCSVRVSLRKLGNYSLWTNDESNA